MSIFATSLIKKHLPGKHEQTSHGRKSGSNDNRWNDATVTVTGIRLSQENQDVFSALSLASTRDDISDLLGLDQDTSSAVLGKLYTIASTNNLPGLAVFGWTNRLVTAKDLPGFETMASPAFAKLIRHGKLDETEARVLQSVAAQKSRKDIAKELDMTPVGVSAVLSGIASKWDDILKTIPGNGNGEMYSTKDVDPFRLVLIGLRMGFVNEDSVADERRENISSGGTKTLFIKDDSAGHEATRLTSTERKLMVDSALRDPLFDAKTGEQSPVLRTAMSGLYAKMMVNNQTALGVRACQLGVVKKDQLPDREAHQTITDTEKDMLQRIVNGESTQYIGEAHNMSQSSVSLAMRKMAKRWRVPSYNYVAARAYFDGEIHAPIELGAKHREMIREE